MRHIFFLENNHGFISTLQRHWLAKSSIPTLRPWPIKLLIHVMVIKLKLKPISFLSSLIPKKKKNFLFWYDYNVTMQQLKPSLLNKWNANNVKIDIQKKVHLRISIYWGWTQALIILKLQDQLLKPSTWILYIHQSSRSTYQKFYTHSSHFIIYTYSSIWILTDIYTTSSF